MLPLSQHRSKFRPHEVVVFTKSVKTCVAQLEALEQLAISIRQCHFWGRDESYPDPSHQYAENSVAARSTGLLFGSTNTPKGGVLPHSTQRRHSSRVP